MLDLFGDRDDEVPTDTLEEALRNAVRADRLAKDPDFVWWRANYLDMAVDKAGQKLDGLVSDHDQANVQRGIRRGIRSVLRGLDLLAERKTFLEEKLNERRRDEPAT